MPAAQQVCDSLIVERNRKAISQTGARLSPGGLSRHYGGLDCASFVVFGSLYWIALQPPGGGVSIFVRGGGGGARTRLSSPHPMFFVGPAESTTAATHRGRATPQTV